MSEISPVNQDGRGLSFKIPDPNATNSDFAKINKEGWNYIEETYAVHVKDKYDENPDDDLYGKHDEYIGCVSVFNIINDRENYPFKVQQAVIHYLANNNEQINDPYDTSFDGNVLKIYRHSDHRLLYYAIYDPGGDDYGVYDPKTKEFHRIPYKWAPGEESNG